MEINLVSLIEHSDWKEILYKVIDEQKLNPWDIDIVALSHAYLEKIRTMKELDLRIPANAILASSILLRFQADYWKLKPEEPVIPIPDQVLEEPVCQELNQSFIMRETRPVSLKELIKAIEAAILTEKRKGLKKQFKPTLPPVLLEFAKVDEQSFEEKIAKVYEEIQMKKDSTNLVLFSSLLEEKTITCLFDHLLPVLHLANKGKIRMWQEEVFGDIFISCDENEEKIGSVVVSSSETNKFG
ncbi:MAG: segregation/condensation protein A [archaeon]